MRYLTLAFFLAFVMGVAGCGGEGDMAGDGADAGGHAAGEMTMGDTSAEAAPMMAEEASDDSPPQWQVLEQ